MIWKYSIKLFYIFYKLFLFKERGYVFLIIFFIIFSSSCRTYKQKKDKYIHFLDSQNIELQNKIDKLQLKFDSLLSFKKTLSVDSSFFYNEIKLKKKHSYKLLLERSKALEKKDSLVGLGWKYRSDFPFFYKNAVTGAAPKSCSFSPNSEFLSVTLLNQSQVAADIFITNSFQKSKSISPFWENVDDNNGYAEGTWYNDNEFWFTRMTTGHFYIWSKHNNSLDYYDSGGVWTKIIQFNPRKSLVAMSHWVSSTVTIFDVHSKKLIREISTGKTPRGIVWLNDSIFATALFGTGGIEFYNANTGIFLYKINGFSGNARDIQLDKKNNLLYYSNMGLAKVFKYDLQNKKHIGEITVDYKPNTIRLTSDNKYLFVSCRGPNNKEGYTKRSPRNGDIYLIDTQKWKVITFWRAGNQPTGLDISLCGKFLAQTDFQDRNVTLWLISI